MQSKNSVEPCRICGATEKMSDEHVPAKESGNKGTVRVAPLSARLFRMPGEPTQESRLLQGGWRDKTLCASCNNWTGSKYQANYVELTTDIMAQFKPGGCVESAPVRLRPLNVLKAVLCNFLSINASSFSNQHPALQAFVKQPDSNDLPEKYRVFGYLTNGVRMIPAMAKVDLNGGPLFLVSEWAHQPLGWVLTIDGPLPDPLLTEVTHWKQIPLGQPAPVDLIFRVLAVVSGLPLDYRTEAELKAVLEEEEED